MRAVKMPLWRRETPSRQRPRAEAPRKRSGPPQGPAAMVFGLVFLASYAVGIVAGRLGISSVGEAMAAYAMDEQSYQRVPAVFGTLMSASFLQATAVLLCGFSAVGAALLALFFVMKGIGLGLCAGCVYSAGGAKALTVHWLLNCLPDLAILLLTLWLAMYAVQLCGGVSRAIFGGAGVRGGLVGYSRQLIVRYIAVLLALSACCAIGAGSAVFFAGVLL